MKILFLTDNFPPEVNAPATRTYEHCKYWVEEGIDITVITCNPNFPQGKVYEGYKNNLYKKEIIDGIKVIRVWSYISANKGFMKRTLDFFSYAVMAFFVGLFQSADIVIATSPQFFAALSGRWLSFFKRKPWIMEVRDLWPESIKSVGVMTGDEKSYKLLEKIEKSLYQSANKIIVVTDTFKKIIAKRGINSEKIHVIKNGVVLENFSPIPKNEQLVENLQLHDKFVIGYIGTHGMAHALDFVLECAKAIKQENIHFLLIGDGAEKHSLLQQKERLRLSNVTMLPFQSKSEIKNYISVLDVALVNLKKSDTFKSVIPSKIFENASMLKPILLGVEGESQEIIEKYEAGICFEPENKRDFLDKINLLSNNREKYDYYKENCKSLANDFDRNVLAMKMLDYIKELS